MSSEFLTFFFVTILIEISIVRDLAEKTAILFLEVSNPHGIKIAITAL
jgi:hypothetical protein